MSKSDASNKESDILFYKKYADLFLEISNELLGIFDNLYPKVEIKESFSVMLLRIYQIYMLDVFPGCQALVINQQFFSFSIMCRSILDITTQLMFILDLKSSSERQKAVEVFLSFSGVGKYTGKNNEEKTTYQWQDLIIKDRFDYDKNIKRLGLDCEGKNFKSTFDYLSKIIHWNPKIINKLVGLQDGYVAFGPEKLNMFLVSSSEFIKCAASFIIIFSEHFYPEKYADCSNLAIEVQKRFFSSLKRLMKVDKKSL